MPELTKFDNGINVITDKMNETETVSTSIWVNVGSRYEDEQNSGISHFLEHMAFKGTKTRTARQIAEEFDNIGGHFNAYTSREQTVYTAKVLKDDFAVAADILSDILQNSTFDEEELERERDVILQEIAMTNDTPDDVIFDHHQSTAYSEQPFGRSILGSEANVQSITQGQLKNFMASYYHPKRMVISVAGNIDHVDVSDFWAKHFNDTRQDVELAQKEKAKYKGGEYRQEKDLEQVHIVIGFNGVDYLSEDYYAMHAISNILGGGMSSRFFQEIREKKGLAYSVGAYSSSYEDTGILNFYGGTTPDKANEMITTMATEANKCIESITDKELDRVKAQIKSSLIMGMERSGFRSEDNGKNITCFKRFISADEHMEKLSAVTTQKVQQLLGESVIGKKLTFSSIGKISGLMDYEEVEKLFS